jgi:D-serine deaminase-like pyridoxal phosphate-dependent protein
VIEALLDEPLGGRFRAFGDAPGTVGEVGSRGWSLPARDLPFPQLAVIDSAVSHNLSVMHGWCSQRGLRLAPHGKTHMAPQLVRRQLDAGAWGMTAASVHQAAIMLASGARRVIIANEVVGVAELERLARLDGEVYCLVDSLAGVERLAGRSLRVLVEVGPVGGRAGARSAELALAVAEAVRADPQLEFAGVEAWEGGLGHDRSPETLARVDEFLAGVADVAARLQAPLVTAGGSAYFDRVAELLPGCVLRSGCYLTHDHGLYERVSPLPSLRPALRVWSEVLSVPEPGLAIAGFGKRDAPFDIEPPIPLRVVDRELPDGLRVDAMNDQHAFLRFDGGELRVGDLVVCGISHPCTAFDKWSLLPLVDDSDGVIGAIRTLF